MNGTGIKEPLHSQKLFFRSYHYYKKFSIRKHGRRKRDNAISDGSRKHKNEKYLVLLRRNRFVAHSLSSTTDFPIHECCAVPLSLKRCYIVPQKYRMRQGKEPKPVFIGG